LALGLLVIVLLNTVEAANAQSFDDIQLHSAGVSVTLRTLPPTDH
jgi:hypothetical protein